MSNTETGYNGWKNYETWVVHLWLSNDEPLYREAREMALRGYDMDHHRADAFKDWVEEMALEGIEGFQSYLISSALADVDWEEVATAFEDE